MYYAHMTWLREAARGMVLVAAAVLSVASSSSSRQKPAAEDPATAAPRRDPSGAYSCFTMRSESSTGSLCFATIDRCESERTASVADGAQSSPCRSLAPVSCFQLGGSQNPSMEMCAESQEDCELWRTIDQDKNGTTGDSCTWRHDVASQQPQ
jgi:hypothetical protein